ncbi:hypothetical protein ACTMU2_18985 [Cupriavidus basilensis]
MIVADAWQGQGLGHRLIARSPASGAGRRLAPNPRRRARRRPPHAQLLCAARLPLPAQPGRQLPARSDARLHQPAPRTSPRGAASWFSAR